MEIKYPNRVNEADVDCNLAHVKSVGLEAETDGLLVAAHAGQDQILPTRSYQHRILNQDVNPMCRVCNSYQETIDHVTSGCPELAKSEYIYRHNKTASFIHWNICKEYNIKVADK